MIDWIRNYKSSSKKLTFHNVFNFIGAYVRKFFHSNWEEEQREWRLRRVEVLSPECFEKKQCYCYCDLEDKIWEDDPCDEKNNCYPRWMTKDEWSVFKGYGTVSKLSDRNLEFENSLIKLLIKDESSR